MDFRKNITEMLKQIEYVMDDGDDEAIVMTAMILNYGIWTVIIVRTDTKPNVITNEWVNENDKKELS